MVLTANGRKHCIAYIHVHYYMHMYVPYIQYIHTYVYTHNCIEQFHISSYKTLTIIWLKSDWSTNSKDVNYLWKERNLPWGHEHLEELPHASPSNHPMQVSLLFLWDFDQVESFASQMALWPYWEVKEDIHMVAYIWRTLLIFILLLFDLDYEVHQNIRLEGNSCNPKKDPRSLLAPSDLPMYTI